MKKPSPQRLIKLLRWFTILAVGFIFIVWSSFYGLYCPLPAENVEPLLYANQADDNLEKSYLKAIGSAKNSILLIIYALNDEKIIEALKRKAALGVNVRVIHDPKTSQKGFQQLENIALIPRPMAGLMHRKILVIDEMTVWIGSANFTRESLIMHDNLVVGSFSHELALTITNEKAHHHFTIGGQMVEFWGFPEAQKEGFDRLLELIAEAKYSILVGMFTFTHPQLVEALIEARKRGVHVEVVMDKGSSKGISKNAGQTLHTAGVEVRINQGSEMFHHKFALIDQKILINGSANWTRSAFSRNSDCFLVLHDLSDIQLKKLIHLWHVIRATSRLPNEQHFMVFWQRPIIIIHKDFESISMAA
ncbi:MAG: phospholipase D-like domain-containing protein [Chlamydiales bacterium]